MSDVAAECPTLQQMVQLRMSDVAADLPRDVLSDILVRLPVKSVGRSRCVSKVWLSLLTSYDFIKSHLAHHSRLPQEQNLLLYSECAPLFHLTLHSGGHHLRKLQFFNKDVIYMVGSCNGLVLVVTKVNLLWLMNCLTQEYVKLPDSPFPLCQDYVFKKYGFGYDELSDGMKIVKVSQCDYGQFERGTSNCPGIFVDIYSLKMKSWRRLGTPLYGHDLPDYDSCVFVNGAFHWIGLKLKSKYSHKDPFVICAFNLSSETFEEIPAPPVFGDRIEISMYGCKLLVIDGCLGMVVKFRYPVEKTEFWYMKSYSVMESWTKLVIDIKPLCFHGDKILFQEWQKGDYNCFSQERRNRDYKWYHLKDGRVELCLVKDQEDKRSFDGGITYSESLLSPHFYAQN